MGVPVVMAKVAGCRVGSALAGKYQAGCGCWFQPVFASTCGGCVVSRFWPEIVSGKGGLDGLMSRVAAKLSPTTNSAVIHGSGVGARHLAACGRSALRRKEGIGGIARRWCVAVTTSGATKE